MRILEVEALLTDWFRACYRGESTPWSLIDTHFTMEDGMGIEAYWTYEVDNFKEIAEKYHLDEGLYAKVYHWVPFENDVNKNTVLVYVYNSKGEFTFKVTMTIAFSKYKYVISSNGSKIQVVAKHVVDGTDKKQIGLAILVPNDMELKEVFCQELKKVYLKKSPSFDGEEFYSVRFDVPSDFNVEKTNIFNFRICLYDNLTGKKHFETRRAILDALNLKHKPFNVVNGVVSIVDEQYPVALLLSTGDTSKLTAYPRSIVPFALKDFSKVIITDAQDNDWIL